MQMRLRNNLSGEHLSNYTGESGRKSQMTNRKWSESRVLVDVRKNLIPTFDETVNHESYYGAKKNNTDKQDRIWGDRKHSIHGSIPL